MAQKQISRFPLNEKFSGLSGHVPNYEYLFEVLRTNKIAAKNELSLSNPFCTGPCKRINTFFISDCKFCKDLQKFACFLTFECRWACLSIKTLKNRKFYTYWLTLILYKVSAIKISPVKKRWLTTDVVSISPLETKPCSHVLHDSPPPAQFSPLCRSILLFLHE